MRGLLKQCLWIYIISSIKLKKKERQTEKVTAARLIEALEARLTREINN